MLIWTCWLHQAAVQLSEVQRIQLDAHKQILYARIRPVLITRQASLSALQVRHPGLPHMPHHALLCHTPCSMKGSRP